MKFLTNFFIKQREKIFTTEHEEDRKKIIFLLFFGYHNMTPLEKIGLVILGPGDYLNQLNVAMEANTSLTKSFRPKPHTC